MTTTPEFYFLIIEQITPHIFQGAQGECTLEVKYTDGSDVDLSIYDVLQLTMKNFPEKDETIIKTCTVDPDDATRCYFSFTAAESALWLAAPYYAQLKAIRYLRDKTLITSSTGYIPTEQSLGYDQLTVAFTEGEILTGGGSGATGLIKEVSQAGLEGTLTLIQISGAFVDDETITDAEGGSAKANGVLSTAVDYEDTFADDSEDFVADGVRADDELTIGGSNLYVISGFDSLVAAWLSLESDPTETGTGLSYVIKTWDASTSAINYVYMSEEFSLYVDAAL